MEKVMTEKEKLLEDKDEIKNLRKNRILQSAFTFFSEKGIDTIAMTDIANRAEIGVASLYRYYETKDEIAIKTAMWAWENQKEDIMPEIESADYEVKTGLEQLDFIFGKFVKLFKNAPDFLRFIYFFDSYAVRTKIAQERLVDYEKMIGTVQEVVSKAIKKGIEDGSIDKKYAKDEEKLYFTTMHSLFSTAQKLTLNKNMLSIDSKTNGAEQLSLLAKILIAGIKA